MTRGKRPARPAGGARERGPDDDGNGGTDTTEVGRWLREQGLEEYSGALSAEGYDDLEDLSALAWEGDGAGLAALVPKAGHRRKMCRLLAAAGYTPAAGAAAHAPPSELMLPEAGLPAPAGEVFTASPSPEPRGRPEGAVFPEPAISAAAPLAAHTEWLAADPYGYGGAVGTASPSTSVASTLDASEAAPAPDLAMLKIIVVGDSGAGKTSLIERLVSNGYNPCTKATIGMDWREQRFEASGLGTVTAQYWDISGQERFANITRVYYRGARGAVVCYDRSRPGALRAVEKWKADIDTKLLADDGATVPCVLVATKCDIPAADPRGAAELTRYAHSLGFLAHHDTSAKTGAGVPQAAEYLTRKILQTAAATAPAGSAASLPGFAHHVNVAPGGGPAAAAGRRDLNVVTSRRSEAGRAKKKKCCGDG